MGETRTMALEDAIEEFVRATALRRGTSDRGDARDALLAYMARELVEQRGHYALEREDLLARAQERYAETWRELRRHRAAVSWALGEGNSIFEEEQSKLTHMNGVPVLRYWWRAKLSRIARGK